MARAGFEVPEFLRVDERDTKAFACALRLNDVAEDLSAFARRARGRITSMMSSSVIPVFSTYGSSFSASSRAKMDSVPETPTPAELNPVAPWTPVFQFGTVV